MMNGQSLLSLCRNELAYAISKWAEGLALESCVELLTRNLKSVGVSETLITTYVNIFNEKTGAKNE